MHPASALCKASPRRFQAFDRNLAIGLASRARASGQGSIRWTMFIRKCIANGIPGGASLYPWRLMTYQIRWTAQQGPDNEEQY